MRSELHSDPNAALLPPMERVADRYRVRSLLGKGGFGAVYEAYDELEERPIALKLIRRDQDAENADAGDSSMSAKRRLVTRSYGTSGALGDNVAQAFKDEFRLLTQLHHPNLATVYDFGRCSKSGALYFTQELVEGVRLSEFFQTAEREQIVDVVIQLARALDYIHALGLIHGDVKPSNVLVSHSPGGPLRAKLIDFGLARMLRKPEKPVVDTGLAVDSDDSSITVLGTPGYSAPEKVASRSSADARSDIYSLAATIYGAVRGQRPFPGKSFREVSRAQRDWHPELAGALLQRTGPVVAELVGRMLEPDPERRPQSARSVVLELLRREPHYPDRTSDDRRAFAQVLVDHLPFVDRANHLAMLLERVDALRSLAGRDPGSSATFRLQRLIRSIVVKAPEGMGKRRLMSELRREIQLADGLFVHGTFWANDRSALGPYSDIVIQLLTALGNPSGLRRRFADLIAFARGEGGEASADQLTEFLIACAAIQPYVLHLSHLSRAPEHARALFERLCRAVDHSDAPIFICSTTEPHRTIAAMLQRLGRDQVAEVWSVRPFSLPEIRTVLHGVFGDVPTIHELATTLDKLTGGHPLSFRETLRVLIEDGILVRDGDSWTLRGATAAAEELHRTLAHRCELRLDEVGTAAWEIARVLYLFGAPIEEDQLHRLSSLKRERFVRTIERLEGEGLVSRSHSAGAGLVQLAHESVREAVRGRFVDKITEAQSHLAGRIGELDSDEPTLWYVRARLLDAASDSLDVGDELEHTAERLLAEKRPQLAAQVLDHLIARLRRQGGVHCLPRLLRAQLQLLEHAAGALEDPRVEATHYEAGILVAELLGDHRAQALFLLGLTDRYIGNFDMDMTLARLERAAAAAGQTDDRVLQLRIANRRAEVFLAAGDVNKAGRWSRIAMEIVDVDDADPAVQCHIMGVRLRCLSLSGQLGEARLLHEQAKDVAAKCPVVHRNSYLSGIAYLAALGGDPQRAIPEIVEALSELQDENLPRLMLTPLHNLGDLQLRNEQLEEAGQAFREVIRLGGLYGSDYHVHFNRGFLGYVLARQGDVEEGAAMLAEARDAVALMPGQHLAWQQLRLLDAEVAHMFGQSSRARRELEEMLADFHTSHEVSLAHWAQEALARIERDLGANFIEAPLGIDQAGSDPEQDTVRTKPVG